jgi:hypothetical protein
MKDRPLHPDGGTNGGHELVGDRRERGEASTQDGACHRRLGRHWAELALLLGRPRKARIR